MNAGTAQPTEASRLDRQLFAYVAAGNAKSAAAVLARGANPEAELPDGRRPAHVAAALGHVPALDQLRDSGARLGATAQDGATPLWAALVSGRDDAALRILASRASMDTRHGSRGFTPAMAAAALAEPKTFEAMLDTGRRQGTDIDARTTDGMTSLFFASMSGSAEKVGLALRAGADPLIRDAYGRAARDVARSPDARRLLAHAMADASHGKTARQASAPVTPRLSPPLVADAYASMPLPPVSPRGAIQAGATTPTA